VRHQTRSRHPTPFAELRPRRSAPPPLWPYLSFPGLAWLALFFVLPFYTILAVAMGTVDPILLTPEPIWNPLDWNTAAFDFVFDNLFSGGGAFQKVFGRTIVYVAISIALSLAIAYPVAYFVARHAGRFRVLLVVGIVAPFFISYLMRMLAWINLLQEDGWVNDVLVWLNVFDEPRAWLDGQHSSVIWGLVYGYVPFMILALFAFLDRIDPRVLEAARDLGASPFHAFRLVTLPLSKPAILAGTVIIALPMFGDYYPPDLLSGSPNTSLIGNQIQLYIQGGQQRSVGSALTVVLMIMLLILMVYYLVATARAARRLSE
jgi:spermidine/putrescine transport system permease protein